MDLNAFRLPGAAIFVVLCIPEEYKEGVPIFGQYMYEATPQRSTGNRIHSFCPSLLLTGIVSFVYRHAILFGTVNES